MATTLKRELSMEERADATRLNDAWRDFKTSRMRTGRLVTQGWLGDETGLGSQGLIAQYLHGVIPLNLRALLAFCKVLGVDPAAISPRLAAEIATGTKTPEHPVDPRRKLAVDLITELPDAHLDTVVTMLKALAPSTAAPPAPPTTPRARKTIEFVAGPLPPLRHASPKKAS